MDLLKAPGPNGFQELLYQKCCGRVGDDVCRLVLDILNGGQPTTSTIFYRSPLVLIPKNEKLVSIKHFRLISL